MYTKTLFAGWADMDFNSHMKNTAYLDKTADVRQMFLAENGFPVEEFMRLRIGPVVMKNAETLLPERALHAKPREVVREASVNRGPDPGSRGRRVAPQSVGYANCGLKVRAEIQPVLSPEPLPNEWVVPACAEPP
jgi:hypothetical protein